VTNPQITSSDKYDDTLEKLGVRPCMRVSLDATRYVIEVFFPAEEGMLRNKQPT